MEISEKLVSLPGGEILFARLASNLLQSGEIDEAQKLCERGLKRYPAYAQAHYILAKCYLRKNMTDEARAELERVLRYDANHIKAIRDLAGIYLAADFQDLYKEYLLRLYTLDPLNGAVIEEFIKSGLDEIWSYAPEQDMADKNIDESSLPETEDKAEETLFLEDDKVKSQGADPLFPDKIDLSQFDNLKDDFTTILHGNLDSPNSRTASVQESENAEKKRDNRIIETVTEDKARAESIDVDQGKTVNTSENHESPIKGSEGSNNVEAAEKISELDQMANELEEDLTEIDDLEETFSMEEDERKTEAVDTPEQETKPEHLDGSIVDSGELDDEEKFEQPKIISQTLGEILVSQKKYVEAKAVFEALKEKQPENRSLDVKIAFLDKIIGLEKK